jgi:hypothetical protein
MDNCTNSIVLHSRLESDTFGMPATIFTDTVTKQSVAREESRVTNHFDLKRCYIGGGIEAEGAALRTAGANSVRHFARRQRYR